MFTFSNFFSPSIEMRSFFLLFITFVPILFGSPKGALIKTTFKSKVGILLDEVPVSLRDKVIATQKTLMARATRQTKMTGYRQVYRSLFQEGKKQLTIPPEEVWKFKFQGDKAQRQIIEGHDYLAQDYSFESYLITREDSVPFSEPDLVPIGGVFEDNWLLPVDPEGLFQRTGYACMDEEGFPRATVDSENTWVYYDDTCTADSSSCHVTTGEAPFDCSEALSKFVGSVNVTIRWERVAWNDTIASQYRFGKQRSQGADLDGVHQRLQEDTRVAFRYFEPSSCALSEGDPSGKPTGQGGCIAEPGWRRLLRFSSSQKNVGKTDLHLGNVTDPIYLDKHIFEFDPCHQHYHFQHYGNFRFGNLPGRKVGFCLQTTWRYHNNEYTPLHTPYDTCNVQGISVGWGDDYISGLECQWIDVTNAKQGYGTLEEVINPDLFLCEGTPVNDANGDPVFIKTNFTFGPDQEPVYRGACNFTHGHDVKNTNAISVYLPRSGSFVSQKCNRFQVGETRDCGFYPISAWSTKDYKVNLENGKSEIRSSSKIPGAFQCNENTTVSIKVSLKPFKTFANDWKSNRAFYVRVCEASRSLRQVIACEYVFALGSATLSPMTSPNATITFNCPAMKEGTGEGNLYGLMVSDFLAQIPSPYIAGLVQVTGIKEKSGLIDTSSKPKIIAAHK